MIALLLIALLLIALLLLLLYLLLLLLLLIALWLALIHPLLVLIRPLLIRSSLRICNRRRRALRRNMSGPDVWARRTPIVPALILRNRNDGKNAETNEVFSHAY